MDQSTNEKGAEMVSPRFRLFLSLIPLILTITQADHSNYFFQNNICSDSTPPTPFNGTFGENLKHLLSSLVSANNATTSTGFYSSSYGEVPDKVYAVGYCRGDLKPHACAACLATSSSLILKNACPGDVRDGAVGSINCTLRYSNSSISGIRVAFSMSSYSPNDNVTLSFRFDFSQRLNTLLGRLASEAADGSDVRKFAVGHSNAPNSSGDTIYGLVQCSPDLSEKDCSDCFSEAWKQLPPCCYKSWIFLGASCSIDYEPLLFYDPATDPTPLPPPSPPPPPPQNPKSNATTRKKDATAQMILVLIGIFLCQWL